MITEPVLDDRHTSSIRRITEGGQRWRVLVETWRDSEAFRGRLVFRREAVERTAGERDDPERESAPLLHGRSRTDVLGLAHDVPEARLRQLLHSLG
jgi:hypothetical protein